NFTPCQLRFVTGTFRCAIGGDVLTDGILTWEEPSRERFVDYHDRRLAVDVLAADGSTVEQPDPHRSEVVSGHGTEERHRWDRIRREGAIGHAHRVTETSAGERQARRC